MVNVNKTKESIQNVLIFITDAIALIMSYYMSGFIWLMEIRNNTFDNTQLEKLVRYELAETEDNNIISEFLEKIRNIEGGNEIMTNASRIINNEIRKQRREGKIEGIAEGRAEGKAEGIALMAKKLKGKMHIKDISQITGLSEEEIIRVYRKVCVNFRLLMIKILKLH